MTKIKLKTDPQRLKWFHWWEKVDDITSGQPERICTEKYIVPFQTEGSNEAKKKNIFYNRLKRTPPRVESPSILDQMRGQLAQRISFEGFEGPTAETILDDVDGWGHTAQNKFSERLWYFLKDGQVGTLIEAPEEVAENLLESQLRGERSFQIIYQARDILELKYFTQGPRKGTVREVWLRESQRREKDKVYERVRRYYFPTTYNEDGQETGMSNTYSVQILEREESETAITSSSKDEEKEYTIIEELQGSLERIPFVVTGEGPEESALYMILGLDIALVRAYSLKWNIDYYQGFRMTFIFGVTDNEQVNQIGEYLIHCFPSEGNATSIDPGNPESVERGIKSLIADINRIAFKKHNTQLMDDTRQVQSAESKAKDLVALQAFYNDILDMVARKEKSIYRFHAMFEGLPEDNIMVEVERDFGLDDPEIARLDEQVLFNNASQLPQATADRIKQEIVKNQIDRMDIPFEVKAELKLLVEQSTFSQVSTASRALGSPRGVEAIRRQRNNLLANGNGAAAQ